MLLAKARGTGTCKTRRVTTIGKDSGGSSAPAAPNPQATAQAQTAADINTAIAQGYINRTNQTTPFGTSTFNQTGTQTVDGHDVPTFSQTVSLAPAEQQLLGTQQGIKQGLANLGQGYVGQIPTTSLQASQFHTPTAFNAGGSALPSTLDPNSLPSIPGQGDLMAFAQQNAQQQYNAQAGLLQPQFDQSQESLDAKLANQGLAVGGQASNSAQGNFQRNRDLTLAGVAAQAQQTGLNQANQLFGQGVAGQQQAAAVQNQGFGQGATNTQLGAQLQGQQYTQQLQNQNQDINLAQLQAYDPLNRLSALVQGSGAISTPQFGAVPQTGVQGTDVLGSYGLQQNALNTAYNAQVNQQNSIYGGLAGLGGAALISQPWS